LPSESVSADETALQDGRRGRFERTGGLGGQRRQLVERYAERVDHTAEQGIADADLFCRQFCVRRPLPGQAGQGETALGGTSADNITCAVPANGRLTGKAARRHHVLS
jgi:hypothetical protein